MCRFRLCEFLDNNAYYSYRKLIPCFLFFVEPKWGTRAEQVANGGHGLLAPHSAAPGRREVGRRVQHVVFTAPQTIRFKSLGLTLKSMYSD